MFLWVLRIFAYLTTEYIFLKFSSRSFIGIVLYFSVQIYFKYLFLHMVWGIGKVFHSDIYLSTIYWRLLLSLPFKFAWSVSKFIYPSTCRSVSGLVSLEIRHINVNPTQLLCFKLLLVISRSFSFQINIRIRLFPKIKSLRRFWLSW